MEQEQLEKRIEWLDEERRKAVDNAAALEKRLAALEKGQTKRESSAKTLGEYKKRLDAFEKSIADLEKQVKTNQTADKKEFQTLDKQAKQLEKTFQQETKGLNKVLEDFRKELGQLQALQKTLNAHGENLQKLEGQLPRLSESIQTVVDGEQKRAHLAESLEKSSQEDAQRLTELRSEVTTLLPKLEAAAKQADSIRVSQRKVEKRMEDVNASEADRKQQADEFLERSALEKVERERVWKEWGQRFDAIEKLPSQIAERLKAFEKTENAMSQAQKSFDELTEKISRRINELNEIQRLGDQRFRQEWSTFQADSQKRWSNFVLTQDEQHRDRNRQLDKLNDQVIILEDNLREAQDALQRLNDQSERTLQSILEVVRDALAENERYLNNAR